MENNIDATETGGMDKPELIVTQVTYEDLPPELRQEIEKAVQSRENLSPCQKAALENKPCPDKPPVIINSNPYYTSDADGTKWVVDPKTGEKTRIGNVSPNDVVKPVSVQKKGFWWRVKQRIIKDLAFTFSPFLKHITGERVDEITALKRISRCVDCKHLIYSVKEEVSKCGLCFCVVNTKVRAENTDCPAGKWNFDNITEK